MPPSPHPPHLSGAGQASVPLPARPGGVINNCAEAAAAGCRCPVSFRAASADVKAGGGILSSSDGMCHSDGEEATRASFPESPGLRSHTVVLQIIPPLVPERVSDPGSIDIPLSSEGENPAGSVVPRPPHRLLLIFTWSWPYFTRVTHAPPWFLLSSVSVCGRAFWVICALLDNSQDGRNGTRMRTCCDKQESRDVKELRGQEEDLWKVSRTHYLYNSVTVITPRKSLFWSARLLRRRRKAPLRRHRLSEVSCSAK